MEALDPAPINVVVGIVSDGDDRVLIQRREDGDFAGMWEFPGGKIENGEVASQTLARELREELGVQVDAASPLIRIRHRYADREVVLDTWRVEASRGEPQGVEGQMIKWVAKHELRRENMLPADRPITTALNLPNRYLITPQPDDEQRFIGELKRALAGGIRLLGLHLPDASVARQRTIAKAVKRCCASSGTKLIIVGELDSALAIAQGVDADGIHVTAADLDALSQRPLPRTALLCASTRNVTQIARAAQLDMDFVVLGPVLAATAPESPLGFKAFCDLVERSNLPVYGAGGLSREHVGPVRLAGGQGCAATRAFWPAAKTG